MRVLLVTPTWQVDGGVARHVRASAALLRDAGHDVRVIADDPVPDHWGQQIPGLTTGEQPAEVRRAVVQAAADFDVVHLHNVDDAALVTALSRQVATVISAHGWPGCPSGQPYFGAGKECFRARGPLCVPNMLIRNCKHRMRPSFAAIYYRDARVRLTALAASHVSVAHSSAVLDHLHRNKITNAEMVSLPVQVPDHVAPIPNGSPRVIYAGRLVPAKGLQVLLGACRYFDGNLEICGDGPTRGLFEKQAEALGISERVTFHGWCSQETLERLYQSSHLAVVPSLYPEPFGLAGPEAMSQARAVVGSKTGGTADWLTNGQNGLAVSPGRSRELGEAVAQMLADRETLVSFGTRGRRDVIARFSPQGHVDALEAVYGVALERSATNASPPRP